MKRHLTDARLEGAARLFGLRLTDKTDLREVQALIARAWHGYRLVAYQCHRSPLGGGYYGDWVISNDRPKARARQ